jgi:hypothetical protein
VNIVITPNHPSALSPRVVYTRVEVDGYPTVLIRAVPASYDRGAGWLCCAPDGTNHVRPTQREAVETALGITLTNWSA